MASSSIAGWDGEHYTKRNKRGSLAAYRLPDFQYSALGRFIIYRLMHNRDVKVIITSSGSTTGTGKTTLAIHLCRWVREVSNYLYDRDKAWNATDDAYVDLYDYFQGYKRSDPGDPLLLDEVEKAADRRRAMAQENVKLSQAWAILRYKNVVTVCTLPTTSMLDGRLEELGDVWINVIQRGQGHTWYLTVNDFTKKTIRKRFKVMGFDETISWQPLDDDSDFKLLSKKKEQMGVPGIDDTDHLTEKDLKEHVRQLKRKQGLRGLKRLENGGIDTQTALAETLILDQSTLSKYKREELESDA